MTREELSVKALNNLNKYHCTILELITGAGKSKIAIDMLNASSNSLDINKIPTLSVLLVVAKTVHKDNWLKEFKKWHLNNNINVTIECYESLHKYKYSKFGIIILDEIQHLSERRREILRSIKSKFHIIGLSATIKKEMKEWFKINYNTSIISCSLQEAIDSDILPAPTIYLYPMILNNTSITECIVKNKGKGRTIRCKYKDRWQYLRNNKNNEVIVSCTEAQYLSDLNTQIEWWKNKYMSTRIEVFRNTWLKLCNDRLIWLSNCKTPTIQNLLNKLKYERTLTFCSSIAQTEKLGENCIHSKNNKATEYLKSFNEGRINHITSCQMLNEGVNLENCRIGIFANINASEIITKQRNGRLLRHKNPIIIVPYYKNTREEELVNKMLEEYNKEFIKTIYNFNDIQL